MNLSKLQIASFLAIEGKMIASFLEMTDNNDARTFNSTTYHPRTPSYFEAHVSQRGTEFIYFKLE